MCLMINKASRGELWGCGCRGHYQRTNPQLSVQKREELSSTFFKDTLKSEISLLLPFRDLGKYFFGYESGVTQCPLPVG